MEEVNRAGGAYRRAGIGQQLPPLHLARLALLLRPAGFRAGGALREHHTVAEPSSRLQRYEA